ncbi:MAG: LAGLIDADG family homing endonuclease [Nanoarchaeota archaeon]
MRIILKKGYQRKLILRAKEQNNLTWQKLTAYLGFTKHYWSNELFNEKISLNERNYLQLCKLAGEDFSGYILKKLANNWGQSKGGKNSGSFREPKLLVTKPSKELAEITGIILGDGNIWCKSGGYYYVRIAGDAVKDRDYLLNYVKPIFEKLFKKKMHKIERPKNNELFISIGNKDIVFTLKHFGLSEGDKLKNNVQIPRWVFSSKEYLRACVRGLIDTDGSVCPITGRNYPYIWFSSAIENLRKTFDEAMNILEIKTSKWNVREGRTPDVYIGSKEYIAKYLKTISFKNERHLSKIGQYAPVV